MKPRKKYNPNKHRVSVDSYLRTIRLSKPIAEDSKVLLNEQIHAALLAITSGVGRTEHFDVLASTVDIVFMMSSNLFGNDCAEDIEEARKAMFRLKDRFHKFGSMGFDGEGYQAIKKLIIIHDEVMNNVTGSEMLQFMQARQKALAAGNVYQGAVV